MIDITKKLYTEEEKDFCVAQGVWAWQTHLNLTNSK